MERIKRIKNPYQDRINALNARDIDEGIKVDKFLYKKREPIPNDINDERFPMTDILPQNVLKPEDLSMKDLLDQIQIQTILNNNIAPFVDKKIKSEVTQEMIKQFQYDSTRPVEINGKFYKYKPPGIDIDLTDVPPPFPSETEYKGTIQRLYNDELKIGKDLERRRVVLVTDIQRKENQYNDGRISQTEFQAAVRQYETSMSDLSDSTMENESNLSSLSLDYDLYDEYKLEYDTKKDLIEKENKKQLATYEDELKSRNSGMEVSRTEGESEEDYAQRLIDTAQTTVDPAQVEQQAKLFLYNSVKDLMNELTPAYKTEAILNTIVQAGGYEKLQPIKDQFPAVKKLLIDTFGNVARVENTDSVAQVMYNYTMKPFVRPAEPPPTSSTLSTQPTVSSANVRPPFVYSRTQVPARSRQDIQIFEPKAVRSGQPIGEYARERAPVPLSASKPPSKLSLLKQKLSTRKQYEFLGTPAEQSVVTPLDIAYYLKSNVRPYPTDIVVKTPKLERVGKRIPPEVGIYPTEKEKAAYEAELKSLYSLRPPPLTRSKSLEERTAGQTGRPQSQLPPRQLREILAANGLPISRIQKNNYDTVKEAGLLPPKLILIPREEFIALGKSGMAQYLTENRMTTSGGAPIIIKGKPKPEGILLTVFDRYKLTGSGFKSEHIRNVKDEFAIIDGEIQSGNNNPQLMRDARKMLKEMVTKKLVTLYEAQKHMLHLRKINKI